MKDRADKTGTSRRSGSGPGMPEGGPKPSSGGANESGLQRDQRLAARCQAGEVAAWEHLYAECHGPLLASIEVMLRPGAPDGNLVDEIAARVWYALVANDGELLGRYAPERGGRLRTFLRALAKDEIMRHFRSERRRHERELATLREKPRHGAADIDQPNTSLSLTEFLSTLTPYERSFCDDHLLSIPPDGGEEAEETHSSAVAWQLSHRIHQKLLAFLGGES